VATVFQTINKSIIVATVSMYRQRCLVVSGVKGSGRQVLKLPTQTLREVALFQLLKGDFTQGIIASIFRIEHLENNGILFAKICNV